MSSEARERIAEAVDRCIERLQGNDQWYIASDFIITDAVIAHLWQRADDPATVEAEAKRRHALRWGNSWDEAIRTGMADVFRDEVRSDFAVLLTALLGPRPDTEQERE